MRERLNFWDFVVAVVIPVAMLFGIAFAALSIALWVAR